MYLWLPRFNSLPTLASSHIYKSTATWIFVFSVRLDSLISPSIQAQVIFFLPPWFLTQVSATRPDSSVILEYNHSLFILCGHCWCQAIEEILTSARVTYILTDAVFEDALFESGLIELKSTEMYHTRTNNRRGQMLKRRNLTGVLLLNYGSQVSLVPHRSHCQYVLWTTVLKLSIQIRLINIKNIYSNFKTCGWYVWI